MALVATAAIDMCFDWRPRLGCGARSSVLLVLLRVLWIQLCVFQDCALLLLLEP